jgi:hypothetical protein
VPNTHLGVPNTRAGIGMISSGADFVTRSKRVVVCPPLSSEYGIYKTVKAIFWPWLSGESPQNVIKLFPLLQEREFFVANSLVRIHLIIEMTLVDRPRHGFEFPFSR